MQYSKLGTSYFTSIPVRVCHPCICLTNTVKECQRRWRTLRERYVREMKTLKTSGNGSNGADVLIPWKLACNMEFLAEFVKHRRYLISVLIKRGGFEYTFSLHRDILKCQFDLREPTKPTRSKYLDVCVIIKFLGNQHLSLSQDSCQTEHSIVTVCTQNCALC